MKESKAIIKTKEDNLKYNIYLNDKYWASVSKTNSLKNIIKYLNSLGIKEIEIL